MAKILKFSGHDFDLLRPDDTAWSIIDIAHGLSNLCRYAGHTTEFYSVAQHCVVMSRHVPQRLALTALFHDAAEALVGDMPTPLKALLEGYRTIETSGDGGPSGCGHRGAYQATHITRRRAEGVKDSSINRELAVLSAAINNARYHLEWNLPNPVQGRMLKDPEGRVRWISQEDAVLLLEAARASRSPYLADLIVLALNKGMRREEMLGLEWCRVDLQAGLIRLEARHTKAGKRRSVPLNRAAREAVISRERFRAKHCPVSPWVFCRKNGERIREARKGFLAACAKAEIADFCFHDLRHTCAAWLVSAGVPLTDVRDLLGHSTVSMTERYAYLAPERVRSAVAVLDEVAESRLSHV